MPCSGSLPWWKVPIRRSGHDRAVLGERRLEVRSVLIGGAPLDPVAGQEVDQLAVLPQGDRRAARRDVRDVAAGAGGGFQVLAGEDRRDAVRPVLALE